MCSRRSEAGLTISRWSRSPTRTYWDYTQLRFPRREGMRIDFVLGSPALAGRVSGALIDREERKGKGASDHAPVIVELTD
ncbi:MAG: endonuclease/exonuclease/phosphatase family protein [Blastococcus sp.]